MKKNSIKISLALLLTPALSLSATDQTWKNVDKELNTGVHKANKQFVDGKPKTKKTGNSVTDGLNSTWDSMLGGVGKLVGSQQEKKKSAKK